MADKNKNYPYGSRRFTSLGLGIGLVLGGLVGILIGNPIIFAGGGLVLGLAIGTALDRSR